MINHLFEVLSVQSKFDNVINVNQWNLNHFMTNTLITQSQKRFEDSMASLFLDNHHQKCDFLFLKSSTDIGVERNGGRNGARLAPQSFLAYFKKLNKKPSYHFPIFKEFEVANECEELENFHSAQLEEAKRIRRKLQDYPDSFICHLGGGHDHVFPLLMSLGETFKKVIVINIDAHADTRTDLNFHSGTPFRQFAESFSGEFNLYQIGLQEFANSVSTLSPIPKAKTHFLFRNDLETPDKIEALFREIGSKIDAETVIVFSLDADALNGAMMPGVSAVNGNGLSRKELNLIGRYYKELPLKHRPILGIYELNPVYDTLSMLSMRMLGTFLYELI
jgi:formiminoglutamase